MVGEDLRIIELLKQHQFSALDIESLEDFKSRDGFQRIKDEDLAGMTVFFEQYPQDYGNLLPIMTDDNSNYLCVYFRGAEREKVCHLSHDEIDLTPRFKSIERLIHVIITNPEAWDFEEIPQESFDF